MSRPERRAWYRLAWQFGLPVREAQDRIDSAEFAEWCAFMLLEPDIGTRADWLCSAIAMHLARIEAAPGGSRDIRGGKLIEWGRTAEDDEAALYARLKAFGNGNSTTCD